MWAELAQAAAALYGAYRANKREDQPVDDESGGHSVQVTGANYPNASSPWMTGAVGALNAYGQIRQNRDNQAQAQKMMDFQERMSNTSWQRALADMKKAGLNPALAYDKGGASSPGGASSIMGNIASSATSSALQAAQAYQSLQQVNATIDKMDAETTAVKSNTALDIVRKALMNSQIAQGGATARHMDQLAENAAADLANIKGQAGRQGLITRTTAAGADVAEAEASAAKNRENLANTAWGKHISPILSDIAKIIGSALDFKNILKGR